jgi:hypothetical protein
MTKVRHYFITEWLDIEIDLCSWLLGIFWRSNYLRVENRRTKLIISIEILFLSITFYF